MSNDAWVVVSTNDGIQFPNTSTGDMLLYTGYPTQKILLGVSNTAASMVTITSNAVGINKSNPQYPLDVDGDLNFTGTFRQNGVPYIGSQWSNNSSNVFLLGSNVGIGNSNPLYPLDVTGDINFTGAFRQNGVPYVGSQWSNTSSNIFVIGSNVALGKSNANYMLDITGDMALGGNLYMTGKTLAMSGVKITKDQGPGTLVNVSTSVVSVPGFCNTDQSNVDIFPSSNAPNTYVRIVTSNVERARFDPTSITLQAPQILFQGPITVNSNIIPSADVQYDLGSATNRFRSLYIASNTIDMQGIKLKVNSNSLLVTDSNNSNTTITVQSIQVGSSSNSILISVDSNNNMQFINQTLSNNTVITSSNPLMNAATPSWTACNTNLYVLSSNVGINTSNPAYQLDVDGDVGIRGSFNLVNKNMTFQGLKIAAANSAGIGNISTIVTSLPGFSNEGTQVKISTASNNSSDYIRFVAGNIELARFTGQGYLGLNTTTPQYPLDVNGDINFTGTLRKNGTLYNITGFSNEGNRIGISMQSNSSADYIRFFSSNTEIARFNGLGYLGIGTVGPSYKLDVNGDVNFTGTLRKNGVAYDTPAAVFASNAIPTISMVPTGAIIQYGANVAPTGWLMCDGSFYSSNIYVALYAIIGTTYGTQTGGYFAMPDLRGRVPVGYGDSPTLSVRNLADTGGAETVTLTTTQIPAHSHSINDPGHTHSINDPGHTHASPGPNFGYVGGGVTSQSGTGFGINQVVSGGTTTLSRNTGIGINTGYIGIAGTANTGGGGSHENMPPFIVVNYIIKY